MSISKENHASDGKLTTKKSVRPSLSFEQRGKSPVAQIHLAMHVINRGQVCLTPECHNFEELSEDIDRFVVELEAVKELAREQLTKAMRKNYPLPPAGGKQ